MSELLAIFYTLHAIRHADATAHTGGKKQRLGGKRRSLLKALVLLKEGLKIYRTRLAKWEHEKTSCSTFRVTEEFRIVSGQRLTPPTLDEQMSWSNINDSLK